MVHALQTPFFRLFFFPRLIFVIIFFFFFGVRRDGAIRNSDGSGGPAQTTRRFVSFDTACVNNNRYNIIVCVFFTYIFFSQKTLYYTILRHTLARMECRRRLKKKFKNDVVPRTQKPINRTL